MFGPTKHSQRFAALSRASRPHHCDQSDGLTGHKSGCLSWYDQTWASPTLARLTARLRVAPPTEDFAMPTLTSIEPGFYRIPLPEVLSDSMHGRIPAFELNTVRIRDSDGAEGVGYTFTVGRNGAAIDAILTREMPEIFDREEADHIERLWQKGWWALHYGGRGGPTVLAISAFDMALGDLKAKRAGLPLWNYLGGYDPKVPCYAGGVDLDLTPDQLLRQTDANLAKGFRAIKMKVGRKRLSDDLERVQAMRGHLGDGFPLMVDANMKWTVDEAI